MDVKPRAGRKRSEESRLAILTAALELVAEFGYARLTIEGIAARSGAGKQTIYAATCRRPFPATRWPTSSSA